MAVVEVVILVGRRETLWQRACAQLSIHNLSKLPNRVLLFVVTARVLILRRRRVVAGVGGSGGRGAAGGVGW